jgi:ribosomal protein S30
MPPKKKQNPPPKIENEDKEELKVPESKKQKIGDEA